MFGKKKVDGAQAQELIAEAIADTDNKCDRAYATGLIEMAFALGAITMNERAALKEKLYAKELVK